MSYQELSWSILDKCTCIASKDRDKSNATAFREVSKNDNEACLQINTGAGFYLLCSTISEKHSRCIVCPQLRTLVPCNESNRYCRWHSSYRFWFVPETVQGININSLPEIYWHYLITDWAILSHWVLHTLMVVAQYNRIARPWYCGWETWALTQNYSNVGLPVNLELQRSCIFFDAKIFHPRWWSQ